MAPRVLVNFAEAHNVGHVVEALRYALGHRAAVPDAHVALVLNRAAPVELARCCPGIDEVFDVPMYGTAEEVERALAAVPGDWDYVLDNIRRVQPAHADVVPGFAAYYAIADRYLHAPGGHGMAGQGRGPTPGYVPHQPVRLDLGAGPRARAREALAGRAPRIAVLPAGSAPPALYPSARSWAAVLDAIAARLPGATFVLVGKLAADGRTTSSVTRDEVDGLLAAHAGAVDAFDRPVLDQLALVEACDVLVSTHSGFGWAALAVDTPWLTISGGRWPEIFFNDVPFVSVLPDPDRFGRFSLYAEPAVLDDDEGDGPRALHVCAARIRADLDRITEAADRLVARHLDVETAMREHFARTVAFLGEDHDALFSIDGVHARYTDG